MIWFGPTVSKIAKWRSSDKYDKIAECLLNPKEDIAQAAYEALWEDKPEDLKALIAEALSDFHQVLHKPSLRLLFDGALADKAAMSKFLEYFETGSQSVKAAALELFNENARSFESDLFDRCLKALAKIDKAAANDAALKTLTAESPKQHRISALKQLLSERESPAIRETLQAMILEGRFDEIIGTVRSGAGKELKDSLYALLLKGQQPQRLQAIAALEKIHWPGAHEQLLLLLDDNDEVIREEVQRVLQQFGELTKRDYVALLANPQEKLRLLALRHLLKHLDRETITILMKTKTIDAQITIRTIVDAAVSSGRQLDVLTDVVLSLEDGLLGAPLISEFCRMKAASKWLRSEQLLNAFYALDEAARLTYAKLLVQAGQREAVSFYYAEALGTEPPWELLDEQS